MLAHNKVQALLTYMFSFGSLVCTALTIAPPKGEQLLAMSVEYRGSLITS